MLKNNLYPFTAVVGQEEAKKALLIALGTAYEQAACS